MRPARRSQGIALITVLVVLVALALIATPFALSMRGLESSALLGFEQEAARADALAALDAAAHHLAGTHPLLDATPFRDDLDEVQPPDLPERYPNLLSRDPRGVVASVRIEDEQGKVDLTTATPWLLGNLLGGRTHLTAAVGASGDVLPVAGTAGFPPLGIAWIGRELAEYDALAAQELREVRRGLSSASLLVSQAVPHAAGEEVLDLRLLLLAQHGWRMQPGEFAGFARVDGLKDIGLYGELTYTAETLERVRPWLTAHGGAPRFTGRQRVLGAAIGRDGWPELLVPDGRLCGAGTVLELRAADGAREWLMVLSATDWGDAWRLALLEPPALRLERAQVSRLQRTPVNVNTCAPEVLVALLSGLSLAPVTDVITQPEAEARAPARRELGPGLDASEAARALDPLVDERACSAADVRAALAELETLGQQPTELAADDLATLLTGVTSLQPVQRLSRTAAEALAGRLRQAAPGSHEELREALAAALAAGEIGAAQRDVVLMNALDPGDARLSGGTAPFAYATRGTFTVQAAASRNLPNGLEQARTRVREVLSPGLQGESAQRLDSQRDFVQAAEGGAPGWQTFPEPLEACFDRRPAKVELDPQAAPAPETAELESAAVALAEAWARGAQADRAGALLGDAAGASVSGPGSFCAPSPVRSALPDTLHFDELQAGLAGSGPRGWDTRDGPLLLPLAGLRPGLSSSQGLLGTFAFELWVELHDLDAETVLLDAGLSEVEDRVLLVFTDRQLVLRVDDTGIKDFEARMPKGRAPPAGEIRYAFDDGLPLAAGVPYHVAALVGGSRDRDMALFVDGVPRGRRSVTTALVEDLPASTGAGAGVSGYRTETKVKVESTAGFPERGALRIGGEVLEYTGKEEGAFLVRAAGAADPFGGRGRRDSLAADHPASELVELVGWTRPLGSTEASRGNGTLGSALGKWAVAELDPTRLTDPIMMEFVPISGGGLPVTLEIGTGLTAENTTVPVRATGAVALEQDTFSTGGGHAILFCDYGITAVTGASFTTADGITVELGASTTGGSLGGAEVIRYTGFDGSQLTGVSRNTSGVPVPVGGKPSDLAGSDQVSSVAGGSTRWADPREYVTTFDSALTGAIQGLPLNPRVLVIPISADVNGGDLYENFHPNSNGDAALAVPDDGPLVQIDVDFPEGDGATEWVRWDTATTDVLVRDDGDSIDDMLQQIMDEGLWDPSGSTVSEDTLEALNDDLDFRGPGGTVDNRHVAGAPALPTLLLGLWHVDTWNAFTGLPGRHDGVTLVSPDGDKEWHRVNWATSQDEEWGPDWCVVGLRDAVTGTFVQTDPTTEENYATADLGLDRIFAADESGEDEVILLNEDIRMVTRVMCSPSGELPSLSPPAFHVGEDWSGRRSEGTATVDELRFHAPAVPGRVLPDTGRYVLVEDLEFDEDRQLRLGVSDLQFPHARRRHVLLGADALEILSQWPQGGGLLLLGEEIIGYAGLDPVDTGHVFITARGLYGTARAFHSRDETCQPLLFWPASPLAGSLDETAARVPLADADGFPSEGLLLVDEELIGYQGSKGADLLMPERPSGGRLLQEGLLRGRFGTSPARHDAGSMVRWMPARYRDRALLGEDAPESEALPLVLRAPGAAFTELQLTARLPDAAVGLDLRVVPDGLVSPHADPAREPRVLAFSDEGQAGEVKLGGPLFRQADRLDLWLFARWRPGAFDGRDFAAGGWKLAPEVQSLVVGHVQPTLVFEHEELR